MTLNWVDDIIILLLAGAIYAGLRIGFLRLLFLFGGFFGGLFLSGWLLPHLLPIKDKTLLTIINGNLVLICALLAGFKGYDWGKRLHFSLSKRWRGLESSAGISLSLVSVLLISWLVAAQLGTLPFAGLSNSASDALIVRALNKRLPPTPSVFNKFNQVVDPNTPPKIFVKQIPTASLGITPTPIVSPAVQQAGASVVRVTTFGCGGISSGSGFVVAPGLVATNAHVVAGAKRPIVKISTKSFAATAVLFNPNLDLAVLKVPGLAAEPLALSNATINSGAKVAVIGFPGSNFAILPGVIRDNLTLFGTNIYNVGHISRQIYEIQAAVAAGDSGGPIVLSNGQVAGIIFAKSDLAAGYGYALTTADLSAAVRQAQAAGRPVSTRSCFAD